jgi:hypothetical protein
MQQMTDIEIDTEMYISGALKRNSMHRIMWRIRRNARAIVHTQLVKDGLIPADLLHRWAEAKDVAVWLCVMKWICVCVNVLVMFLCL